MSPKKKTDQSGEVIKEKPLTPKQDSRRIRGKRQRKGRYYLMKSRDYMKNLGYETEIVEKVQRIVTKDDKGNHRVLFAKADLWGADLVARNKEDFIWIQVKSNRCDTATGIKQLSIDNLWPSFVKRWVMLWEPRMREPEIIEFEVDKDYDEESVKKDEFDEDEE